MTITVNGNARAVADGATVAALLNELDLNQKTTVVERNGDILDRAQFDTTSLAENDVLEVVRLVGGG